MSLDDVRQPKPVKFTLEGEDIDLSYWFDYIKRRAEGMGYDIQQRHASIFTIYPRAVND